MDQPNSPQPEQVQFNIPQLPPQLMPQPPPEQLGQPPEEPEPEKKKGWKKWVIIITVIIIAAGLGFYFLSS